MKKITLLIISLGLFFTAFAQMPQQTELRDPGTTIKEKTIYMNDPCGGLNDAGVWEPQIVIKVELREKNGEQFVFKTVLGYMTPSTGNRINLYSNREQLQLQSMYGGKKPAWEY